MKAWWDQLNIGKIIGFVPLLILLLVLPAAAQITIGPVTLGKFLPDLPACQFTGEDEGPCRDGVHVWNVPYDGAGKLDLSPLDSCLTKYDLLLDPDGAMVDKCPIAQLAIYDIPGSQCTTVLAALKKKFGPPVAGAKIMTNAFGAIWKNTRYRWNKTGGSINLSVNPDFGKDSCDLFAATNAWHAEKSAERHKKVTF